MANLFTLPRQYVSDQSGAPMMGAKLYFYQVGSSTPKDSYTDSTLFTANANPVEADAYGVFPVIWLDSNGADYRVVFTDQHDVVISVVDGLLSEKNPTQLLNDIKTVDGSGSGLDADLLDGFDSTIFAQLAQDQTVTGTWNFTARPLIGDEGVGYLNIPVLSKISAYTLNVNDRGKDISITTGGIYIPVNNAPFNIISVGSTYCVYNDSAVNQSIQAVTPATTLLRLAATISTGTRTLAPRGLAVCHKIKSEEWLIYGPGVN
jgi:hypothetical protein